MSDGRLQVPNSSITDAPQHNCFPVSYVFRSLFAGKRAERVSSATNISDISDRELSEMSETPA